MKLGEKLDRKLLSLGMRNHYSNATIELTSRCNARCDYCYIADNTAIDLSTEKVYQMLDKLADAGVMNLIFTGGEPFIRDDILDILSYSVQKQFWKISFLSNSTLLSDAHLRFFADHTDYIGLIQFSVFSHIPEIHDTYMGVPGGLEKLLAVCAQLKEIGIQFQIAVNVLDFNVESINETINFFCDQGYYTTLGIHKIIIPQELAITKQNITRLKKSFSFDFLCSMLDNMPPGFLLNEQKRFFDKETPVIPSNKSLVCRGLIYTICIDAQGNLRPCNSFRNLTIGSIFDDGSLHDIVERSDDLKNIKALRRSDLEQCRDCHYSSSCNICIGQIHTETGCLSQPSQQLCTYAKALEHVSEVGHASVL